MGLRNHAPVLGGNGPHPIPAAKQSGVLRQRVPPHHAHDRDGRGGIPAACLPAVRRNGTARHDGVPAGQEYGP